MEFTFSVNNLFGDVISKVDNTLMPSRSCPGSNEYKRQLKEVINEIGEASGKAQSLRGPITSASKMSYSDHILYLMKDPEANSGLGAAIGILKIGAKRLFVYDSHGVQHEMEPMCVLDFYVHESRQRTGCGRKLFDFMLRDQNVKAAHLAVDKPSHKFSQFLQKHYHLKATIPQVNNFVIFMGFFQDRHHGGRSSRITSNNKPPLHPYHRQNSGLSNGNCNNQSSQAAAAKLEREDAETEAPKKKEALKDITVTNGRVTPTRVEKPLSGNRRSSSRGLLGQNSSYSRHTQPLNPTPPLPEISRTSDVAKQDADKSLQRGDNTSTTDYSRLLNSHQDVYDRRGHLKISSNSDRHSAPINHHANVNINTVNNPDSINNKTMDNKSRIALLYGSHTTGSGAGGGNSRSSPQNNKEESSVSAGQKSLSHLSNGNSDALLPNHFKPYSELRLPASDPYGYRESTKKQNDSSWNVFGVSKEPKSYSASDRFRSTRPW